MSCGFSQNRKGGDSMKLWQLWLKVFLGIFFVFVLVVALPLSTIWALNTLFGTTISINLQTWMAMIIILTILVGGKVVGSSK